MRFLNLLFLPALAYQVLAIVAAANHLRRRAALQKSKRDAFLPAVSVLKPVRGLDPNTLEAFLSQADQNYPDYEVLFGVGDANDPVTAEIERVQRRFPHAAIRLIVGQDPVPNGKVGVLARLGREARNPIWVVNDGDIKVTDAYLRTVVAPLRDDAVGVVTCLYRASAHTPPAGWEAIGIATDFMPSTLVAQLIGVREFGLGSTLAFRAEDFRRVGGFEEIGAYLADDYQLAKRITGLGKRALLSTYTVETALGESSWMGSWQHQIRWARTIRTVKGGGYAGLPITQAGIWIAIALFSREWPAALALIGLRMGSALLTGSFVLKSPIANRFFWLAPFWDLYSFGVWLTSYAGREVRWRDRVMTVDKRGRIRPK